MSENMIFCLGDGSTVSYGIGYQKSFMVFNEELTESEFEEVKKSLPVINLPINYWVEKNQMSNEEKDKVVGWSEMGGYLKKLSYEEAWAKWWSEAKQEEKEKILNCKYFDAEIFKGITGIEISSKKSELLKKADELIKKAEELREEAKKYEYNDWNYFNN